MTDRYENIRKALEGLRERCAQESERGGLATAYELRRDELEMAAK